MSKQNKEQPTMQSKPETNPQPYLHLGRKGDAKITKWVGCFEVALYNGNFNGSNSLSVVRAWDNGESHTVVRKDPCVSWKLFEGEYEEALAFYKSLERQWEIERRCDPVMRNPRASRTEEIMTFRKKYGVD